MDKKKMNDTTWKRLLGWVPDAEMKKLIIQSCIDERLSIEEATARYAMPPLYIGKVPENPEYDNPLKPAILIRARRPDVNQ